MKKENRYNKIEEFEDSLTDEEKEKYNKGIEFSIVLTLVSAFSIGLFMGSFGLLIYVFYDMWIRNDLDRLPTVLKNWYEEHQHLPFLFSLIGSIINALIKYNLSYQIVENSSSIWG